MRILTRIIIFLKFIIFGLRVTFFGKKRITKTDGKISYSSTVAEINFEVRNIKEQLDYMAENYPNKVAFIFHMNDGLKLTYSDLKDRSYILARSLMSLGLKKGDRIALLLPNTYEIVICYFASALSGLIVVPFDAYYGYNQIDYMLKSTEPSAVVLYNSEDLISLTSKLFPELNSSTLSNFRSDRYPSIRSLIVIDDHEGQVNSICKSAWSYSDLETKRIDNEIKEFPYVDPDDIFAILSTSGTTGRPKGTIKRYFEVYKDIMIERDLSHAFPLHMTMCQTLLMYHLGSTYTIISQLFRTRYTVVFPSYKLDPVRTLEAIAKYNCNMLICMPKILSNLLDENEKRTRKVDLSNILIIGVGGQHQSSELIERTRKEFTGVFIYSNIYGSTECNLIASDYFKLGSFRRERYKSCVGEPYPFVECKIVNPENGQIQPLNVEGELHVRSFSVMSGYWNDIDMTKKVLDPTGWLNTGDVLSMDEKGFLYYKGRSNDVITAKGWDKLEVFPSQVEECLMKCERINEAVVFGIPVGRYESEICVWVKLNSKWAETTVDDIIAYCRNSLLDHQVPKYVKIVDSFPVSRFGKYLRNEMRSQYKKELGI